MGTTSTGQRIDFDTIGSGDFGTIVLAEVTYGTAMTDAHVAVWGDGGGIEAWTLRMVGLIGVDAPNKYYDLAAIQIKVKIKSAPPMEESWSKAFEIRWSGTEKRFHVAEAAP